MIDNLALDRKLADKYRSGPQRIRVLSEDWVARQAYCPNCGRQQLEKYRANNPAADFSCAQCREDYELKSKQGTFGGRVVDGAYTTLIGRLRSGRNPNLFLLGYDLVNLSVAQFSVVPKQFFVPDVIEKRPPLAMTARRANWVGCNILLTDIPHAGRIFLVRDRMIVPRNDVTANWRKTLFLREQKDLDAKGWLVDVMKCVDEVRRDRFRLHDIYAFEEDLLRKHPANRHIKEKIRQQLQILRDKGYLKLIGRGEYARS